MLYISLDANDIENISCDKVNNYIKYKGSDEDTEYCKLLNERCVGYK